MTHGEDETEVSLLRPRIWQTWMCQPGRSYPFTEEQEVRNADDVALKLYDAGVFTVQLCDKASVGELARRLRTVWAAVRLLTMMHGAR